MGKKKDQTGAADDPNALGDQPGSAHKKHKKHKKKHKRRKGDAEYDSSGEMEAGPSGAQAMHAEVETVSPKAPIKLKLIISKQPQSKGESSVRCLSTEDSVVNVTDDTWEGERAAGPSSKKGNDDRTQESSDDEWLDALEKGELDDYGEIKRNKDPSLLTSRQRALKHGIKDNELLQLPSGYKSVELTEEQLQRRQQRAKKRREQAQEKREKDKKQTMERLLKKQETKSKGARGRSSRRANQPHIRYVNNADGCSISLPPGMDFPMPAQPPQSLPAPVKCGLPGCTNEKKYACSQTHVPLCSLECYKKNLAAHGLAYPPPASTST